MIQTRKDFPNADAIVIDIKPKSSSELLFCELLRLVRIDSLVEYLIQQQFQKVRQLTQRPANGKPLTTRCCLSSRVNRATVSQITRLLEFGGRRIATNSLNNGGGANGSPTPRAAAVVRPS